MVLKGILAGQKKFVTKLLEPHKIHIQDIEIHEISDDCSIYQLIYDVARFMTDPVSKKLILLNRTFEIDKSDKIAKILNPHYPEHRVEVDLVRGASLAFSEGEKRWRIHTKIYFWKRNSDVLTK